VVKISNNLQAIFGTRSENLKGDIEAYLRAGGSERAPAGAPAVIVKAASGQAREPDPEIVRAAASIAAALGGAGNIVTAEACALTRVRVKVVDAALVKEAALRQGGVAGVMRLDGDVLHLIVGPKADAIASATARALAGG
jgi:PTS system glucose-specific IIC component